MFCSRINRSSILILYELTVPNKPNFVDSLSSVLIFVRTQDK